MIKYDVVHYIKSDLVAFHQRVDFTNNASICHDTIHFATATAAAVADPAAFHDDDGGDGCRIQ